MLSFDVKYSFSTMEMMIWYLSLTVRNWDFQCVASKIEILMTKVLYSTTSKISINKDIFTHSLWYKIHLKDTYPG
jgi:hypothetical protein